MIVLKLLFYFISSPVVMPVSCRNDSSRAEEVSSSERYLFNNCLNVPINLKCVSSVVTVIYDFSMQNLFGVKKSKGIWAPGVSRHRDLKILWELR